MLRKIDNERRKADELQKVRESYEEQVRKMKQASWEREKKMTEIYEKNERLRNVNKSQIGVKLNQLFNEKKANHDELKVLKQSLEQEKA